MGLSLVKWRRTRLNFLLRKLAELRDKIDNPAVKELLHSAYIDILQAIKVKEVKDRKYNRKDEIEILQMFRNNVSYVEIERVTGFTRKTIVKILIKYSVNRTRKTPEKRFLQKYPATTLAPPIEKRTSGLPNGLQRHSISDPRRDK